MTTSGEPRTAAPYSIVPSVSTLMRLPASRDDEEFADSVAAENKLWRHAAVSAGDDRRPRRLMPGDVAAALSKIHGAKLGMAHEALIARLELGERFLRRQRSRRAFRRVRCPRSASGGKRDRRAAPNFINPAGRSPRFHN